METTVVNVQVKYIRPKYNDLEEWCNDANNVYIGRKGIVFVSRNGSKYRYPKQDSIWHNPKKVDKNTTREEALDYYIKHINKQLEVGKITVEDLEGLRGKKLGCWCKEPGKEVACHGDILLDCLQRIDQSRQQ